MNIARFLTTALCAAALGLVWPAPLGRAQSDASNDSTPQAEVESSEQFADPQESHGVDSSNASHAAEESAGHGELHIPHDVTSANMSPETWEVVEFRTDIALFTAVVFLLLLAGLYAAAWKPLLLALEKRERRITDNIARAEKAAAEAEARLAEYEARLAAAGEEVQQMLAEARKDSEAISQRMIAEAQEEAQRLRERALSEIDSAKRIALSELATRASELAFALAQRIVQREIKPEDHQDMIRKVLSELPSRN